MKRDPSALQPLNLARTPRGGWVYVQKETGFNINGKNGVWSGDSFWALAMRLHRHRRGNKLDRQDYESCQRDILVATRASLGLPDESAIIMKSNVQQFIEKKKGGCAGCGKKRKKAEIGYL